jgi:hypothetical protein
MLAVVLYGRYKNPKILEAICALFIANICITNYLYMPFNHYHTREFVFWSIILQFRCAVICLLF